MPEIDGQITPQSPARLRVRINQIDHTLVPPGSLDNSSLPRVPVLRIFGSSSTGKAACVHIHQVYPYFFVEYTGNLNHRQVNRYISKLLRSLNHAISLSLKRRPESPRSQFIRAIVLVKGIHFYGFHTSYTPFLKILVADPTYVTRIVAILQSGSVMGTRFRVFESHLSYILQFLCDFGLYGCGEIEIEDALERCPETPDENEASNSTKFGFSSYFRESRLPLEVDVIAPHILNRHRLFARDLHHRSQPPSNLPPEPLVLSVRELWEDERKHRQSLGLHPSPEIPIDPSESSRAGGGEWVAEARWWDEIHKRIERERGTHDPIADNKGHDWERFVMTAFESVEAIWEKEYKTWKPARKQENGHEGVLPMAGYSWEPKNVPGVDEKDDQIEVDISLLSNQDLNQLDQEEQNRNRDFLDDVAREEEIEEPEDIYEESIHEEDSDLALEEDEGQHPGSPDPFLEPTKDHLSGPHEYRLESPPTPTHTPPRDREGSLTPTKNYHRDLLPGIDEDIGMNDMPFKYDGDKTPTESNSHPLGSIQGHVTTELIGNSCNVPQGSPIQGGEDHPPRATVLSAKERMSLINARAVKLSRAFNTCKATNLNRYAYSVPPPSLLDLKESLQMFGLASKIYQAPYYSNNSDMPEIPKEFAGLVYRLKGGQGIATLDEWSTVNEWSTDKGNDGGNSPDALQRLNATGIGGWEYASHPPSVKEVRLSLNCGAKENRAKEVLRSQIEGPTQANIYGFNTSPLGDMSANRGRTSMTILSLEIFAATRESRVPNADLDEVLAIFYAHHVSGVEVIQTGVLTVQTRQLNQKQLPKIKIEILKTELDLLNRLIDLILELDPDILTGWDVQLSSWGYLEARSGVHGLTFSDLIARAPPKYSGPPSIDHWGLRKTSTFKVAGRHVLNLWRIMRSERTLTIYTFEHVLFDVLGRRVPKYSFKTLTEWYHSPVPAHTFLLFQHLLMRTIANLDLLDKTETITKTAEFARVFGVDFFSVMSRGSQFKVESFMFRIAKPESFILISPSKGDVGKQNAAECMPLIMEPASAFYSSPLLVLDFQSLYPSIMIAYNYCYSTCIGRITEFQGTNKFGVVPHLDVPAGLVERLKEHITVAPNGIMYVKSNVRKGLLGRMLVELLDTRVMVKQAMKRVGGDRARKRILDARQLSLKYIANVTYGYTGATFSGRMPAVEIADSIVQSGRETLEKAIDVIESTKKWGAKVVYGDTDSVFVYLPGKTKEKAFAIGNEMAEIITAMNPAPIKLKFEKVYLPCVLMAKKRYVGFKYENIDDLEPVFDAKGIETVRRDGVLAQRKMVENCLKILFRTQDLSEVKNYCCRSWTKLFENKAPVHDFIFAKEVRMGTYSNKGPPPPGVVVAARRVVLDPNDEPQYGDRIPYVIARSSSGGGRLADRAMGPLEFMNNSQLRLDAVYYITRVLIPPLERIFNLVGADIRQWYDEMPKTIIPELVSPRKPKAAPPPTNADADETNIGGHFMSTQCLSCGEPASQSICESCCFSTQDTIANLNFRIRTKEERVMNTHRVCASCAGSAPSEPIHCESIDCQWFYARRKAEAGLELVPLLTELSEEMEEIDASIDEDGEGEETVTDVFDLEYQSPYSSEDDMYASS